MTITPRLFDAFLKCPTKCWLRARNETPSGNAYAEWVLSQNESYRATQIERLLVETPPDQSARSPDPQKLKASKWLLAVDVVARTSATPRSSRREDAPSETSKDGAHSADSNQSLVASAATPLTAESAPSFFAESRLHAVERVPADGRGKAAQFIPIRCHFFNKLTKDDKLLLAFDAFVLAQELGRDIAVGKIIHGDPRHCVRSSRGNEAQTPEPHPTDQSLLTSAATTQIGHGAGIKAPTTLISAAPSEAQPRVTKVKTSALAGEVRKRLEKLAALFTSQTPPDLVLSRHCAECEFQARCRQKALETDDLSLLAGMSAKERQKLRSKGIFTVTQLSYTFRPRRRPKRLRDKREKYHHSLKALAIREKKIHIVGSPELKIEGTPVYLDVEGLPDRDFYYLIGLRIGNGDSAVQHSLWADSVADEGKIWREFLAILETVEKPVLIHYGSYETIFLKRMCERHNDPRDGSAGAVHSPMNLLSTIYSRIYLPSHSNRLKEVAALVGARWHHAESSGIEAVAHRYKWEHTHKMAHKDFLLTYNRDDCAALQLLTAALQKLMSEAGSRTDVDFADAPKQPSTERGAELHHSLKSILRSAYSDYSRWSIRLSEFCDEPRATGGTRKPRLPYTHRRLPASEGRIVRVPRKRVCLRHPEQPTALRATRKDAEHALLDLAFTKKGCKKTVVRYVGKRGFCPRCRSIYPPPEVKRIRNRFYGEGFAAWVVYLRVALRLSYRLVAKATQDLFCEDISQLTMEGFVQRRAKQCAHAERALLTHLMQSPAIHLDETKISILGVQQYVWVLTDGKAVIFRLTESRETEFLNGLLAGYAGTIVSDFYAGYDALPYRQQKCLVHLIGDLNDDLWKNPFNLEFERFVSSVRDLLVPILKDVRRYGLKAWHLRKHMPSVNGFYRTKIDDKADVQELVAKYLKRFQRYRDSMFTFLENDDIPWNNNAAERALRHLAVQRKISGAFSKKGASDYLRLLAIAQTCRFQDKSFLGYLLSGLKTVGEYRDRRQSPVFRVPRDDE